MHRGLNNIWYADPNVTGMRIVVSGRSKCTVKVTVDAARSTSRRCITTKAVHTHWTNCTNCANFATGETHTFLKIRSTSVTSVITVAVVIETGSGVPRAITITGTNSIGATIDTVVTR